MRAPVVGKTLASGFCVYLVIAACSSKSDRAFDDGDASTSPVPNAMADTLYASGSRLKVRFLAGEDGSKQFFGWFDSTRNDECLFTKHSDGSMRCLPSSPAIVQTTLFADSACFTPLAVMTGGQPQPKYAVKFDAGGVRVYPVLQPFAESTVYVQSGSCVGTPRTSGSEYFVIGAEATSGNFVAATAQTAP